MKTLTAKANVTRERTVEIPIPFYASKSGGHQYIGLINEEVVIRVNVYDGYTMLTNSKPDGIEKSKLIEAFDGLDDWTPCSEEQFFEHYNAVLESISLTPVLK